ncbi:MAG: tRNA lysidine(34) synthetase TilS [Clostridiales bacterium]|nr:tRNA lysidine(34) synthetase TilS [Clostridiales bacterium]
MLKAKVLKYNERNKLFGKGDRIVVGVSGGKDSVCLLDILNRCKEEYELSLLVVHVNHCLRGEEADRDEAFVKELAESMGLECYSERVDICQVAKERKMTEEEAGRYMRYQIMKHVCMERGYQKIAIAHNQDDVAETVLFQMFRGSGPRGLSGIFPKREYVIRPILFAGRTEIARYVEERNLSFCTDATNEQEDYSRNKIRLRVFPYVEEEINSRAKQHVAKAAQKIALQNSYIEKQAKKEYMRLVHADRGEYYYSCEEFAKIDIVIQIEIIRLILKNFRDSVKDITEKHYKMVISLTKKVAGKKVCLPGNICVERRYKYVWFKNQIADVVVPKKELCQLPYEGVVEIHRERMLLCMDVVEREKLPEEILQKDYTKWFNYDNIRGGIELRNPEEGDFFVMDKQGNKKKLSRYYIDEKIPLSERKREIVLADGKHVLWAVPGRMSDAYKITEETKQVLVVVLTKC